MAATRFGAMTLSITAGVIAPLLAMDQKVTLPKDAFSGLTVKGFKGQRDKLLSTVRMALDGKLKPGIALDASMKDLAAAVDAFKEVAEGADEPASEEADKAAEEMSEVEPPKAITEPGATYDAEPLKAFLTEKGLGAEDIAKCMDMMPKAALAGDEEDDEAKKKAEEEERKRKEGAKDAMIDKPAMDAALKAQADHFDKQIKAVKDNERGVRLALAEVQPWVGEIPATMAFDTAADVYRHALVMKGVDGAKTMHADALKPVLTSLPKIGARSAEHREAPIAMDSVSKAVKLAPGLENISQSF